MREKIAFTGAYGTDDRNRMWTALKGNQCTIFIEHLRNCKMGQRNDSTSTIVLLTQWCNTAIEHWNQFVAISYDGFIVFTTYRIFSYKWYKYAKRACTHTQVYIFRHTRWLQNLCRKKMSNLFGFVFCFSVFVCTSRMMNTLRSVLFVFSFILFLLCFCIDELKNSINSIASIQNLSNATWATELKIKGKPTITNRSILNPRIGVLFRWRSKIRIHNSSSMICRLTVVHSPYLPVSIFLLSATIF